MKRSSLIMQRLQNIKRHEENNEKKYAKGTVFKIKNFLLPDSFILGKGGPDGYHYAVVINRNNLELDLVPSSSKGKESDCCYKVSTILKNDKSTFLLCDKRHTVKADQVEDCHMIRPNRKRIEDHEIKNLETKSQKCYKKK